MINQSNLAIIAIAIIIPLSSFVVYATDSKIQNENTNSKLQVMTSFYPLYEFAEKVGHDKADVTLLVPIGVEPHDWEPTIQDVQRMQNADLIVINGLGFERWIDHLDEINFHGNIVDTSTGIVQNNNLILDEIDGFNHSGDPHIWLNPVLAKIQIQNIADAFSNHDPVNKKYYQQNAQNYKNELDSLDKKIRNELSDCRHDFIAFHDAFSYFSYEYGLNQHTIIPSNNPHVEPTARTLEEIINAAREYNLKIIFTEETADPRMAEIISNEINGKVLVLSTLEVASEGTYISKMTQNLENLQEALC